MMSIRKWKLALAFLLTSTSLIAQAQGNEAATYPSGTVKIVVPYTPGGLTDILGRALASQLEKNGVNPSSLKISPGPLRRWGPQRLHVASLMVSRYLSVVMRPM